MNITPAVKNFPVWLILVGLAATLFGVFTLPPAMLFLADPWRVVVSFGLGVVVAVGTWPLIFSVGSDESKRRERLGDIAAQVHEVYGLHLSHDQVTALGFPTEERAASEPVFYGHTHITLPDRTGQNVRLAWVNEELILLGDDGLELPRRGRTTQPAA